MNSAICIPARHALAISWLASARTSSLIVHFALLVVLMVSSQNGTSLLSSAVDPEASTHALPLGKEPSWSIGAILRSWASRDRVDDEPPRELVV